MFAKTCLAVLPGGKQKQRRNANIPANRLERWAAGERAAFWGEVVRGTAARPSQRHKAGSEQAAKQNREQQAIDLARRGLPGQAVQRLSGLGVATNTGAVEAIMRSKFPLPLIRFLRLAQQRLQPTSSRRILCLGR